MAKPTISPQRAIEEFWEGLVTKSPSKVTRIFPASLYAHLLLPKDKPGSSRRKNAAESYEVAATECRAYIEQVTRECRQTNQKFTDPEFNIEHLSKNCLRGLTYWYEAINPSSESGASMKQSKSASSTLVKADVSAQNTTPLNMATASRLLVENDSDTNDGSSPRSVHRVDWIFDKPKFEIEGFNSSNVIQGAKGDCWFIAAVATLCSNPELMRKVCVGKDEECGIYGFVFFRDGEWIWTVVDDNLYLKKSDFDVLGDEYDPTGGKEKWYKRNHQTGSKALYFASCADENETWLPLLEKAYAKVHGDYDAIAGGISGEAIEDLTGGVTTKIFTDRVLNKERLWQELLHANKHFLFSASSPKSYGDGSSVRRGLALSHAYSIIRAVEVADESGNKTKLVLVRNPWGRRANASVGEWTGPWADGSRQWTAYWMEKLEHKFGDDGLFWMAYTDLLQRFNLLDRTRLFDQEWTVVQRWASVPVAWMEGDSRTKFAVEIKKAGPTVFVLCQLDGRYIRGLEGKYAFNLSFSLRKENAEAGNYIIRVHGPWVGIRSVSAEVYLGAGTYEVLPKIEAVRHLDALDVQEVVTKLAEHNPRKLRQIGLNYDIANAKGLSEVTKGMRSKKRRGKEEAVDKERKFREDDLEEIAEWKVRLREVMVELKAWRKEKNSTKEENKLTDKADTNQATTGGQNANDWSAVCVIGLRVYSQSREVSIELNKSKYRS